LEKIFAILVVAATISNRNFGVFWGPIPPPE